MAIIHGGELQEQDPEFTRKRLFDEFMKSMYGKEGPPKQTSKEKESDREAFERLIKDVKERYQGK